VTKRFLRLCRAHPWYNNILPPVFWDAERQIAKEQAVLDAREHTRRYNSVRINSRFMPFQGPHLDGSHVPGMLHGQLL